MEFENEQEKEKKQKKKKRGLLGNFILVLATIVAVVAAALLFLVYTSAGRKFTAKVVASYLHGAITYVSGEDEDSPEAEGKPEDKGQSAENGQKEVYHVLLLGEEAIRGTAGKGRTDAILLVTIHTGSKKISVTSVLRDTYVEPEGMNPCKINAVYARLGVTGLYQILYEKLGVLPDGYVKVGFDSFEAIVDLLGGAEVTLTEEEAEYLNTHNYISKEEFRNVRAGTQVLNGNQTLGYCRVRYVANCNGTKNDYGRTERQRMVLKNLFERYKEAGVMNWAKILKEVLGYIETDISESTLENLIFAVYDNKITDMEQQQLPAKGTFDTPKAVGNVTSPIVVDWEANKELFWQGIE
ncbi:MAG: LCP family protein [Lachnospiraceae bacterium]|nr:LCP family protein [Lachnospiraceae bacterium]